MNYHRSKLLGSEAVLSFSATNALRLIFEFMVLIHHLYDTFTPIGPFFASTFGPIAVGGFILISGYGVGKSFIKKGDAYRARLIFERIPRNYLMIVTVNLVYLFLFLYGGNLFNSAEGAIASVLYLPFLPDYETLSHYIYFLADLMIYYILFAGISYLFKKLKNPLLWTAITMFGLCFVTMVVLEIINGATGNNGAMRGALCFPAGLIIACFDDEIVKAIYKRGPLICIALMLPLVPCAFFWEENIPYEYLMPLFFSLGLCMLFFQVKFNSKVINYLASLVLYVYVSHEFIREFLRMKFTGFLTHKLSFLTLKNEIFIITIIVSLAFAVLCDLIKRLIKLINKQRKIKRT